MSKAKSILLGLLFLVPAPEAKFKADGCADVKADEFAYRRLVTTGTDATFNEPLKLATSLRGDGKVDLYYIERHGKVKRWSETDNKVTTLLELDTWTDSKDKVDTTGPDAETGLEGIALDPDFRENRRIYLRYEPWAKEVYRISRFEVKGDSIPLSSEKVLLEIPYVREHTRLQAIVLGGAGMAFDPDGNLLIPVGANTELSPSVNERYRDFSAEYTSSNMKSLRGAILRIHPDDSPKGYSIPKGNFGEYWSDWFKRQGKQGLASDYADTSKVKAEIYIKGVRNPYSITVDPARGWVAWGEFGPNRMGVTRVEELSIASHPVNGGYPYWAGKHEPLLTGLKPWADMNLDPKAPMNNSVWNEGPKELPPSDTPRYAYSAQLNNGFLVGNHPISGPLYRYDPESPSGIKFPPHFDKAWFMAERTTNSVRVLQLDETGSFVIDSMYVTTSQSLNRPLDLQQGADGALYVVDYGGGWHDNGSGMHIGRIEYTGSCHPGVATSMAPRGKRDRLRVKVSRFALEVNEPGPHLVRVHDFGGRVIETLRGDGPMSHSLARGLHQGVYFVTVEIPDKAPQIFTVTNL